MFSTCTPRLVLLIAVGAVVAFAANVPRASAATQRYASADGTGSACSAAQPCGIVEAVNNAAAGAEVIVEPGGYYVDKSLDDPAPITIHGVAGQARPQLFLDGPTEVRLQDSTLRYIEIYQGEPAVTAVTSWGTTFDQVIIRGGTQADCAAYIYDGTMSNSLVIATRYSGSAICAAAWQGANTAWLRNVTAIARGGAAIEANAAEQTADVAVGLINVIAYTGPGGDGLLARTGAAGAAATIVATRTNYLSSREQNSGASVIPGTGNQAAPPAFVDPASGDYRQRPDSVTIDAGAYDQDNGDFDIDGDSRNVGSAPDIGADEFVPLPQPPAPTDPSAPAGDGTGSGGTGSGGAGSGGTSPPSGADFAGVKLISSRLALKHGFIVVKLSCPAGTAGRCTGATKLTARRPRTASRAAVTVKLGRTGFSIAPGGQAKVRVPVSRAGRRLFARTRRLRGRAASAAQDAAGLSKTTSARVTIRRG